MKGILSLMAITISAVLIMHCSTRFDFEGDSELKQRFIQTVSHVTSGKCNGDSIVFRLDTLTKFEWDKVYFFYSYHSKITVELAMGIKWTFKEFDMNDYDNLIVFIKNGEVVNYIGFKPNIDDFSMESKANQYGYYTPDNSIISFRKVCYNSQQGYRNLLRPIPNLK